MPNEWLKKGSRAFLNLDNQCDGTCLSLFDSCSLVKDCFLGSFHFLASHFHQFCRKYHWLGAGARQPQSGVFAALFLSE